MCADSRYNQETRGHSVQNTPVYICSLSFCPTQWESPQSRGGPRDREWHWPLGGPEVSICPANRIWQMRAHKGRRELLSCFPAQVTCSGAHQEPVCSCLAAKGEGLGSGCWVLRCFCPPCPVAWLLDHPDFERNLGQSHLMMGASPQLDCQFCGDKDGEGPTSPSP